MNGDSACLRRVYSVQLYIYVCRRGVWGACVRACACVGVSVCVGCSADVDKSPPAVHIVYIYIFTCGGEVGTRVCVCVRVRLRMRVCVSACV